MQKTNTTTNQVAPDPADRRICIYDVLGNHDDVSGVREELRDYVTARAGERLHPYFTGRMAAKFNDPEEEELFLYAKDLHRFALWKTDNDEEEIGRLVQMIWYAQEIDKMACRILGRKLDVFEARQ